MATMTTAAPSMPSRRVFTAPPLQTRPTDFRDEEGVERDIFSHPDANVVSFNAPPALERPGTPRGQSIAGTLPWTGRFETFEYRGRLRIYEPKTEQTMLASWNNRWNLALMPMTQCWCVDNQSKFAIKVRSKIYRIELPWETEEDKARVEEFRRALDKVILLDKTECPFKRGYETETILGDVDSPKARRRFIGKNKTYKLNEQPNARRPSTPATEGSPDGSVDGSDEDVPRDHTPTGRASPDLSTTSLPNGSLQSSEKDETQRSVTVPMLMPPKTPPFQQPVKQVTLDSDAQDSEKGLPSSPASSPASQQEAGLATTEGQASPTGADVPSSSESSLANDATNRVATEAEQTSASEASPSFSPTDFQPSLDQPDLPIATPDVPSRRTSRSSLPKIYPADSPPKTPTRNKTESAPAAEGSPVIVSSPAQQPSTPPTAVPSEPRASSSRKTSSTPSTTSSLKKATDPSTPPNQPPPKARSTTLTSTSQISSPSKFRNSSLVSDDDDIPSLGVFSQALNILRGPPSGLIAVLMGFARRASNMGFGNNGAGGLGLGLSRSHSGSSERPGHQRRKSDMPGTWRFDGAVDNSEDEGPLEDESEEDDFGVPLHNGSKGRSARQRWGSPTGVDSALDSRRASAVDTAATTPSRQRQGPNEWTDSDLD